MTVAVLMANIGQWTQMPAFIPQTVPSVFYPFDDVTCPPRSAAMTPRLLARLPKCWGWQMRPGHDAYLWLDASVPLAHAGAVAWWLEQLGDADIALFRHPFRTTVAEEAAVMRTELVNSRRLQKRYGSEWLDEQLAVISGVKDDVLYAAGAFMYRPTAAMRQALSLWWEHNTRYHLNDQLSLPYVLKTFGVRVHRIDLDIFHNLHLQWIHRRG
jgi:hypothetical protein